MNICAFTGIATAIYYDEILTRDGGKQPFLAFMLRLQGPHKEGPSIARIIVYGQNAKKYYPLMYDSQMVEVTGRYRNCRRHQGDRINEFLAIRIDFPPGNSHNHTTGMMESTT